MTDSTATRPAGGPLGMQIQGPGSIRFSLEDVPEHARLAVFREVFGQTVLRYDLEPLPSIPFDVDLQFRALPGLMTMSGRMHGSRNRRTSETIAADGTDDIGMIVNMSGPHRIAHSGREIVLGDGEATLVSMGDVCSFTHHPPGGILALRVPRNQIAPLVTGIEDLYLRRIPHNTPALRLLASYVTLVEGECSEHERPLQHLVASHVHDLMAMVVGATRDGIQIAESRGLRAARLHAIKQDIAKCVDQNDLSLTAIAGRHHCTPRYVQRLFESEGTTFTDYVLAQRLARAYRLLTDPRRAGEKISAIAFESGFGDVSYFNRAFRQCYGETPSGVRAGRTMN